MCVLFFRAKCVCIPLALQTDQSGPYYSLRGCYFPEGLIQGFEKNKGGVKVGSALHGREQKFVIVVDILSFAGQFVQLSQVWLPMRIAD